MVKPFLKSIGLALWILMWVPPVWAAKKLGKKKNFDRYVQLAYRGMLRIIGLKLSIDGEPAAARPMLVVSNHVSYLDILVLGAAMPIRFTPKQEIASWPVIGSICRLLGCLFVERDARALMKSRAAIASALGAGDAVCVFPEATTGNGKELLPFRPAFFSLELPENDARSLTLQPVAICYTHIWKLPIDTQQWPEIAWYGDMDLLPHVWNMLKNGGISVCLSFLPPIGMAALDRKALAQQCHDAIESRIERIRREGAAAQPRLPLKAAWLKSKS